MASDPPAKSAAHDSPPWARVLGTVIAISTLAIPTTVIAYFSAISSPEVIPKVIPTPPAPAIKRAFFEVP